MSRYDYRRWDRVRRLADREAVQRGYASFWRENALTASAQGDQENAKTWTRLANRAERRARRLRRSVLAA